MHKVCLFLILLVSSVCIADYITISCGKYVHDGYITPEVSFQSQVLVPKYRADWVLYLKGRTNIHAQSLIVKESKYYVDSYLVTEAKPSNGNPYHQYYFTNVEACPEGGPVYLRIYQVGGNQDREQIGKVRGCRCKVF